MRQDHLGAERIGPVHPDADDRTRTGVASLCLETELARGTRSEVPQLATIPLRGEPREALMELAAAQHGGGGTWSGPCLMRRHAIQDSGQVDSDDRIANALVAPTPIAATQRVSGPR